MQQTDSIYTVVKNDCPWIVAKKNLKATGQSVTNAAIIKEMNRLAALNDCDNVDEFTKKFFNRVGLTVNTGNTTVSNDNMTPKENDSVADKHNIHTTASDSVKQNNISTTKMDSTRVSVRATETKLTTTAELDVIDINNMDNDLKRVVEYNKKYYKGEYYGIVNKKNCQLIIYNKKGEVIKSIPVGIGKTKGDGLSNYYLERSEKTKDSYKAEQHGFTTPGEFTLDEIKTDNPAYTGTDAKSRFMSLKGDNRGVRSGQQAIHVVYNNSAQRIKGIKSEGLDDNRMSYGCVNLLQDDYDLMYKYLQEGDKIFILPEEKGNKLQLEKQSDGTYLFHQQNHKNDQREYTLDKVSKVNYDIRPDRNPNNKN